MGKYQPAQLLDDILKVCLVLWETAPLSSKVAVPFVFLTAMHSCIPAVNIVRVFLFFCFILSGSWVVISPCILNLCLVCIYMRAIILTFWKVFLILFLVCYINSTFTNAMVNSHNMQLYDLLRTMSMYLFACVLI